MITSDLLILELISLKIFPIFTFIYFYEGFLKNGTYDVYLFFELNRNLLLNGEI